MKHCSLGDGKFLDPLIAKFSHGHVKVSVT